MGVLLRCRQPPHGLRSHRHGGRDATCVTAARVYSAMVDPVCRRGRGGACRGRSLLRRGSPRLAPRPRRRARALRFRAGPRPRAPARPSRRAFPMRGPLGEDLAAVAAAAAHRVPLPSGVRPASATPRLMRSSSAAWSVARASGAAVPRAAAPRAAVALVTAPAPARVGGSGPRGRLAPAASAPPGRGAGARRGRGPVRLRYRASPVRMPVRSVTVDGPLPAILRSLQLPHLLADRIPPGLADPRTIGARRVHEALEPRGQGSPASHGSWPPLFARVPFRARSRGAHAGPPRPRCAGASARCRASRRRRGSGMTVASSGSRVQSISPAVPGAIRLLKPSEMKRLTPFPRTLVRTPLGAPVRARPAMSSARRPKAFRQVVDEAGAGLPRGPAGGSARLSTWLMPVRFGSRP